MEIVAGWRGAIVSRHHPSGGRASSDTACSKVSLILLAGSRPEANFAIGDPMTDPLHVLVIEDNLGDFHLLEESFEEQGIPAKLYLASNAVQAFSFLSRQGVHASAPTPDLILLDLNLPVIHGAKILDVIRTTQEWAQLPVMVLSSSTLKKDRDQAAHHGIEAYLVKPSHYDGYLELARTIGDSCRRLSTRGRRRSTTSLQTPGRPAPARVTQPGGLAAG